MRQRSLFPILFAAALSGCAGSAPSRGPASTETSVALEARALESAMASGDYAGILLLGDAESASVGGAKDWECGTEAHIREFGCARYADHDSDCAGPAPFAYSPGSCWAKEIPAIDSAGADAIDLRTALFDQYPVDTIARSLVYRHYRSFELPRITAEAFASPAYSLYRSVVPQIMFPSNLTEKIAENGFLNLFQTGSSNGRNDPESRWNVAEGYLHLTFPREDDRAKALAPKSLYAVSDAEILTSASAKAEYQSQYGNVVAVLSPKTRNRMTLTMGGSRDAFVLHGNRRMNTLKWINSAYDLAIQRDYLEGQIWGSLKLGDVAMLLVNCPGLTAISNARIEAIYRATRLPIYSCVKTTVGRMEVFKPNDLLRGTRAERIRAGEAGLSPAAVFRSISASSGARFPADGLEQLNRDCDASDDACKVDLYDFYHERQASGAATIDVSCGIDGRKYRAVLPAFSGKDSALPPYTEEGYSRVVVWASCSGGVPALRFDKADYTLSTITSVGPIRIGKTAKSPGEIVSTNENIKDGLNYDHPGWLPPRSYGREAFGLTPTERRSLSVEYTCQTGMTVRRLSRAVPLVVDGDGTGTYTIELSCNPAIVVRPLAAK